MATGTEEKILKFIHIADCHLGGWREPVLRDLNLQAFKKIIEKCIHERVEFLLIAGDLFNTSLPPIEILKEVVAGLKSLKDNGIRVYAIAGSHDFSPSGKTMLDVLENAALLVNVAKVEQREGKLHLGFTKDHETGVLICGLPGKKGMLDSSYYKALDRESLKLASGTKIFLFHSAISDFKQNEHMDSISLSYLPEGFDYYAGGHVHDPLLSKAKGWVAMPGPLFPNSFAELEKLEYGSMVLCRISEKSITPELLKLPLVDVLKLALDCTGKSCEQINDELKSQIRPDNTHGKLVLIRLTGLLGSGKISDIDFGGVYKRAKGAVFIMRNTAQVRIKEFENIRVEPGSVEDVELRLISEHKSGIQLFNGKEEAVVAELLGILSKEKGGGETKGAYEDRIVGEALLHARKHTP